MMDETVQTTQAAHRDYTGAKMGMWIFLFTEMLLFGGMFLLYSVYRYKYAAEFHEAAQHLDVTIGTINTLALLTSSMTMAMSITALRRGKKGLSLFLQGATILLGAVFLVNKYIEWGAEIRHGIYPGSEVLLSKSKGEILFFGLYFVMLGIHGLHVAIGMGVISFIFAFTLRGSVNSRDFIKLENTGLYWHFVDIVWVYLYPLFYLIT